MKTPFEKEVWTLEFLERLKRDFVENHYLFLCCASSEFEAIWDNPDTNKEIIKIAKNYLDSLGDQCDFRLSNEESEDIEDRMLFSISPSIGYFTTRLNFLNYEIKRLTSH
jgi:hypothetical protein